MKKSKVSNIFTLICVVALVVALFLPYASATEDWMEWTAIFEEELEEKYGMDRDSMRNMSMFEFLFLFRAAAIDSPGRWGGFDILLFVIVGVMGLFELLMLLFALLKKPVPIIVFDVLLAGVYCIYNWLFTKLEIIPDDYTHTFAYYLIFELITITLAGSIWMIVDRKKKEIPVQGVTL